MQPTAPNSAGKWKVALLPQWNAGENASADAGLAGYSVTKQSKHPKETADFLFWLNASKEGMQMLHSLQNDFPTYKPVLESPDFASEKSAYFGDQQINQVFIKSQEGVSPSYQYSPFHDYVLAQLTDALGVVLQGNQTLAQAMTKLQSTFVTYAKQQGFTVK
jgi:multiple sugar transport system substrate-binding protein